MKIKNKFTVFLVAVILLLAVTCFSGCSSITVDGKKLKNPTCIYIQETGFSSHVDILTNGKDIAKVYSFFDGAKFELSDEKLTENDGDIYREICVDVFFGDISYAFHVAENGKTICYFGDDSYISTESAVDYGALKEYIKKLKEGK